MYSRHKLPVWYPLDCSLLTAALTYQPPQQGTVPILDLITHPYVVCVAPLGEAGKDTARHTGRYNLDSGLVSKMWNTEYDGKWTWHVSNKAAICIWSCGGDVQLGLPGGRPL